MRILYVIPGSPYGLSMIFAHKEISRIREAGCDTKSFIFESGLNPAKIWGETVKLNRVTQLYQPDVIHAHFGTLTGFVSALVSKITGVPLVVTFRGSDLNPSPSDGKLRSVSQKILSHLAAFRAKTNICVSCQLKKRLWWCRRKTKVIPTGIDLSFFNPVQKDEARRALGWGKEERIVCFNAGLSPDVKRLDIAERAVKAIIERIGNVRFVVLRGDVSHDKVPIYLSGADCLLLTSDYEGSPDIIKEALACNLPIVSVNVGDVGERLEGVIPSRIVARDPNAIASASAEIIVSGQRSNGRDRVAEISATVVRDKILKIYESLIH
jgi:glycosyltransferase involved in cell wall biosynthesis